MIYSFQCVECESVQEWTGSCSEKPDELACGCGGRMLQLLGNFSVIVKTPERKMTAAEVHSATVAKATMTDSQAARQRAKDRAGIAEMRKVAEESRRSASSKGDAPRLVASMPMRYFKEKNYRKGNGWLSNDSKESIKRELKKDNLWFGD
jgi:predicted nucleic acid-binding Zn ribbon protein